MTIYNLKPQQLDYLYDDISYLLCYGYLNNDKLILFGFTPLIWN